MTDKDGTMPESDEKNSITVVNYEAAEEIPGTKGIWESAKLVPKVSSIDIGLLSSNLRRACNQIGTVLDGAAVSVSRYELDTFEIALELSASGEVRFIGGASAEI